MFKLKQVAARFTQFYHPTPITFKIDDLATRACSLAYYVELYRNHGHHYAQLDPLSLYNTYILD